MEYDPFDLPTNTPDQVRVHITLPDPLNNPNLNNLDKKLSDPKQHRSKPNPGPTNTPTNQPTPDQSDSNFPALEPANTITLAH